MRRVILTLLLVITAMSSYSFDWGLKTNLLGWATTTLNAGVEMEVGRKATVQVFGSLNPWTYSDGKRLRHWSAMPELRLWKCQTFNGHFIGVHLLGGEYNVRNIDLPFGLLPKTEKGRHYEGWFIGAGLTYGYQWLISSRLNIEASVGLGYAYSPFKLYGRCDRVLNKDHRNYVGPTKLAISIVYFL